MTCRDEEKILGLEVTVNNAHAVEISQRRQHLSLVIIIVVILIMILTVNNAHYYHYHYIVIIFTDKLLTWTWDVTLRASASE